MKVRVLAVGVALLAAAGVGDQTAAFRTPAPKGVVPTAPSGGVLACPVATTTGAQGRLYLANVGDVTGRARVFIRTKSNSIITKRIGIVAGQVKTVDLTALTKEASGLAVEWSGGRILASHSLHSYRRSFVPGQSLPRFMSVAQCFEVLGPTLTIAAARTTSLGDTTLAVFNPGPAPADISIAIREGGEYSSPQRLQRRIIRPLSRRDFSLREFAFGSDDITAVITMTSGRVVAEALIENRRGAELISAVPPLSEAMALLGTSGGSAQLSLASVERTFGPDPAAVSQVEVPVNLDSYKYAGAIEDRPKEIPPLLAPGVEGHVDVPSFNVRDGVAYELRAESGTMAAASSWETEGSRVFDLVTVSAAQPNTTWFGLVPAFGPAWRVELLMAAAGGVSGTAQLEVLGNNPRSETIHLTAGSMKRTVISSGQGVYAVVVRSDVPVGAAFVGRSGGIGYGSLPTWLRIASNTALQAQPVVGVGRQ